MPFHVCDATTYFEVPTSQFQLVTNSKQRQNVCGFALSGFFTPPSSGFYGNVSLQGLFGSRYKSYVVSLLFGKEF
jgi:hypothetical protein